MPKAGESGTAPKTQKEKVSHGGHGDHGVIERFSLILMTPGLRPGSKDRTMAKKSSVTFVPFV